MKRIGLPKLIVPTGCPEPHWKVRGKAARIPSEWAVLAWETSGEDFRTDFLNFYRAHGWELSRVEGKPGGRVRMDFDPLQNPFEPKPATHPAKLRPMQFRDKPSNK